MRLDQREQRLAGRDVLAGLDGLLADVAVRRRDDGRIAELKLRVAQFGVVLGSAASAACDAARALRRCASAAATRARADLRAASAASNSCFDKPRGVSWASSLARA
jgi:hypothetical protein